MDNDGTCDWLIGPGLGMDDRCPAPTAEIVTENYPGIGTRRGSHVSLGFCLLHAKVDRALKATSDIREELILAAHAWASGVGSSDEVLRLAQEDIRANRVVAAYLPPKPRRKVPEYRTP